MIGLIVSEWTLLAQPEFQENDFGHKKQQQQKSHKKDEENFLSVPELSFNLMI